MIITSRVHCRETIHFIQSSLIKTELNDKAKRLLPKNYFSVVGTAMPEVSETPGPSWRMI